MDWVCSGCGRHFSWAVSECPYCRLVTTITTGGTQPASDNSQMDKITALLNDGVCYDGGHHKQWHLERIAEVLGVELEEHDLGIAP